MPIVVNGVTLPAYADPADVPAAMRAMSESLMPKLGGTFVGLVDMGGNRISGLAVPTSADDATTKQYVDGKVANVVWGTLPGKPTTFPPSSHSHASADMWTTARRLTFVGDITGSFLLRGNTDLDAIQLTVIGAEHGHDAQYVRKDSAADYLPLTGGNLNGNLHIVGANHGLVIDDGGIGCPQGGMNLGGQATFNGNVLAPGAQTTTSSTALAWRVGTGSELLRQTSSRRFKKDIVDADPSYIERLLKLRPVNYKSRIGYDGEGEQIGLIAEEVHEVAPEFTAMYEDDGKVEMVAYDGMIVPLLMAVQWLAAKVETLEARVAT